MATPIFILGNHRSGTTWLANQLCQHPDIAGVQHEVHFGIHESAYFSHIVNRYGDLNIKSNYVELVEILAASDYGRLAGVSKELLFSLWPISYEDLFRAIMDEFAKQQNASFWLEKTPAHTEFLEDLAGYYPDAWFICVKRDLVSVIASSFGMRRLIQIRENTLLRLKAMTTIGWQWAYFNRKMQRSAKHYDKTILFEYQEMKDDLESIMRPICDFIGLEFDAQLIKTAYVPNTSFEAGHKRENAVRGYEKNYLNFLAGVLNLMPLSVLKWSANLLLKKEKRPPLPPWFFKMSDFIDDLPVGEKMPSDEEKVTTKG